MKTPLETALEYGFTEDTSGVSTVVLGGPALRDHLGPPWGGGLTAAFDESKHPRNPATGRDRKESPSDGGKFKSQKGGGTSKDADKEPGAEAEKSLRDKVADEVLGDAVDTQALYKGDVEGYTQERVDSFQNPLIVEALAAGKAGQAEPATLFMAGGSGSGKSSVLAILGESVLPPDAVMINPDLVKERMPEYRKMVEGGSKYGAAGTHEESSDISKRLLGESVAGSYNAVVDGTGNSGTGKFLAKLDAQKALGRRVNVVMVDIPTDVAVERARLRAEQTGRFIAEGEIRAIHKSVAVNHLAWRDKVDDWEVWSNDGAPGEEKVIARRVAGGKVDALDKKRYEQALAKATE